MGSNTSAGSYCVEAFCSIVQVSEAQNVIEQCSTRKNRKENLSAFFFLSGKLLNNGQNVHFYYKTESDLNILK